MSDPGTIPAHMGDLIALARALLEVDPPRRRWVALRVLCEAKQAAAFRRTEGRVHPRWGDGSLMSAALHRHVSPEPTLDHADYRACLRLVLDLMDRLAWRMNTM